MSLPTCFKDRLSSHTTRYLTISREARQWAPALLRKPPLVRHWLLRAHWAQVILVIFLLGMPSLIPEWIDGIIEQLSPPSTAQKLGRLFDGLLNQPALSNTQIGTRALLWSVASVVVLALFWLHIPTTIQRAQQLAETRQQEADRLRQADPQQSLLLYQSAMGLTLDADTQAALQRSIADIECLSAPANRTEPAPSLRHGDATLLVSPQADTRPRVAARYVIDAPLGQGAMGVVHRAHDIVLDRDVALKQLSPALVEDAQFVARFRQEALALAKLNHPHIVQIYDYIEDPDTTGKQQVWIAMELVEGDDLAAHLNPKAALPATEYFPLALQMAQAMAYAHAQGIVHRDFKPANVLITAEGNTKIMDFGLAKIARSAMHTQVGTVMGSPAFMSPEQAAGKDSDTRADIYAFGVTLYLMCSGRLPFSGDAQAMLAQHLSQTPSAPNTINTGLDPELNLLILEMLAKSPDARPPSMDQVADRLRVIARRSAR